MPRVEVDDLNVWFGTADAPCPVGEQDDPEPRVVVAVSPPDADVTAIVRHRRPGGPWQRLLVPPGERTPEARYFAGQLPAQPVGAEVEYEIHIRRGGPRPRPERRVGPLMTYRVGGGTVSAVPPELDRKPRAPILAPDQVGPPPVTRRPEWKWLTEAAARLDAEAVATALKRGLAGLHPLAAPNEREALAPQAVVWADEGDEALVHVDATDVRLRDGTLLVSVEIETDQADRQSFAMPFALGKPGEAAGLLATTNDLPHGDSLMVARWGRIVQDAVWASLLAVATALAPPGRPPVGMGVAGGELVVETRTAEAAAR